MGHTNPYIQGRFRYRVVAPVVVARLTAGGDKYVYRHALLPDATEQSQIEHLLELGMIEKLAVGA
ncbi:hypothetical protein [Microbacterium sp. RURRCA19A]|uniref:hypothetical protein n=1 Tax=Microbacterium sp. RURRCA19A TaxID=1907391 RepID=UPI000957544F|nr:hypothetical protein [Microbacterium sp. RURRCA19A]SIS19715.1 hypothetical protein SAMN05880568_3473 [Microbacterium sp. RURRCA19A]